VRKRESRERRTITPIARDQLLKQVLLYGSATVGDDALAPKRRPQCERSSNVLRRLGTRLLRVLRPPCVGMF